MSSSYSPPPYPLAVRDSGLTAAFGLFVRTLPFDLARFAVLVVGSLTCIIWFVVTVGGASWLSHHIANAFGVVWFIGGVVLAGWLWSTLFRDLLHVIDRGHVAVLTELIVHGAVANGGESMFAYGRRIVTTRFGEISAPFAMNPAVRGVLNVFHAPRHATWTRRSSPTALPATTTTRGSARDGVIYYCQNAKPILKTSIWIVGLDYVLTPVLWLALLIPVAGITVMLPRSARETGAA